VYLTVLVVEALWVSAERIQDEAEQRLLLKAGQ
jgi:hypothetical protein